MPVAAVVGISISQVLRDLGYVGLALLMLAETVFPPIPSEAVLPLAGYLVEQGEFRFLTVVLTATARHGGRPFANRFMRVGRLDPAKMEQAEEWFARRGPLVVLFGRW